MVIKLDEKKVKACEKDIQKIVSKHSERIFMRAYNRQVKWRMDKRKLLRDIKEKEREIDELKERIK